jgi:serine/threonine-protein kinase
VALKLPHGAWKRAGLAERLAREREILATLEHPNIARLYDAGVAEDGQPWLALEFVEGERLDAYCGRLALPVRERVCLALQMVRAVAHAHGRLVVHRDLKPGNVLVTEQSGVAQVKLLDFGIAKLVEQGRTEATELTRAAGQAFTPEYASPEQVLGEPLTTASDVYSIGVVLFELLSDVRPYRPASRSRAALEEAISQGALRRPSALAPPERRRALRGDLDTIVLKALQREPARRYATADALADDLQRWLERRPVLAQPDRAWYRFTRFVARNRAAVGVAAGVAAALLATAGGALWQAALARAEQQRAEAVKSFVAGLFTDADPFATASRAPTVEALLASARHRLDEVTSGGPEVRVELLLMIADSHFGLGQFERAEPLYEQAVAASRRELGAGHTLARRARLAILKLHRFRGRHADIRTELDAQLPVLRKGRSAAERELLLAALTAEVHLGIDEGRYATARDTAREAVALATSLYGDAHSVTADATLLQVSIGQFLGDPDETLRLAIEARDRLQRVYGAKRQHAKLLDGRFMYGRALGNVGRYREALSELEEVLAQVRQVLGAQAPMVAFVTNDVARFALELGDEPAALRHAEEAVAIALRDAQEESHTVGAARLQLGRALLAMHRGEAARAQFERAERVIAATRGADAPLAVDAGTLHAAALAQIGQTGEAWRRLEPRLVTYRQAPPLVRYRGLYTAGIVKRLQGDLAAAAALQDEALAALPEQAVQQARRNLVLGERAVVALEQGDAEGALRWLDRVQRPQGSAAQSLEEAGRQATRGRALLALQRPAAALDFLRAAEITWRTLAPEVPEARRVMQWRAQAQAQTSR